MVGGDQRAGRGIAGGDFGIFNLKPTQQICYMSLDVDHNNTL